MIHHLAAGRLFTLFFALCSLLSLTGCEQAARQQLLADIKARQAAQAARDSQQAMRYFAPESFTYFDKMMGLARTSSRQQVEAMALSQMYNVLAIRAELEPDEVKSFTGRQYVDVSIARGFWSGDTEVPDDHPEKIEFLDGAAIITWRIVDTDFRYREYYVKDAGTGIWLVDVSRETESHDQIFRDFAMDLGISERESVVIGVEEGIKKEMPESAWDPPQ
jgi:hypothetical protein